MSVNRLEEVAFGGKDCRHGGSVPAELWEKMPVVGSSEEEASAKGDSGAA